MSAAIEVFSRHLNSESQDSSPFVIEKGEIISIVGANGSGKSNFLRFLFGKNITQDTDIYIFGKKVNVSDRKESIFSKIEIISSDDLLFFCEDTVYEMLFTSLKKMKYGSDEVERKMNEIVSSLHLKSILNYIPNTLSNGEKILLKIATALCKQPEILVFDEVLDFLDSINRGYVLKTLKKFNKRDDMTIVVITTNLENVLYTNRIILLSDEMVFLDKKIEDAFNDEKIFKENKVSLPFTVQLSKKLQYYNLCNHIEFDINTMVKELWK